MVERYRQFRLVRTSAINIALSYKRILYIKVTHINCFANSLNTFICKTSVPNSGALFTRPSIIKRLYYNNGLSLNKSINLTSIGL